jgi:phage replication O-like protein O
VTGPQLEDGYTRIANEILEQAAKCRLTGTHYRILLVIWRYTYGFKRADAELSVSFLAEALSVGKGNISAPLKELIQIGAVRVTGKKGNTRKLAFNKYFEEWKIPERHATAGRNKATRSDVSEATRSTSTEATRSGVTKKERKKTLKKDTRQLKYAEDNSYFKMAQYFYERVQKVAEDEELTHLTIKADLQKWADEFRKLMELDKIEDKHLIRDVMDWVTSDSFWKTNILSAKKLRDKFSELAIKMKASKRPKQFERPPDKSIEARNKDIEFQRWTEEGNDPNEFDWS